MSRSSSRSKRTGRANLRTYAPVPAQHACALLITAAENDGSVAEARRRLVLASLLDGRLNAAATEPAG